jgi:hypothetical protein
MKDQVSLYYLHIFHPHLKRISKLRGKRCEGQNISKHQFIAKNT